MISSISHKGYVTNLHLGDQASKRTTTKELQLPQALHKVNTQSNTRVVEMIYHHGKWSIKEYQRIPRRQWWHNDFSSEVHLLAGKLVPVVAIHSLGGSRANRHHMPNPQPGVAQPTQDEDPQAMPNPLELPFVITHEEGTRTPHNHHDRSRQQSPIAAQWSTNHWAI